MSLLFVNLLHLHCKFVVPQCALRCSFQFRCVPKIKKKRHHNGISSGGGFRLMKGYSGGEENRTPVHQPRYI